MSCFIATRDLADSFVASREEDNKYERKQERNGSGDMPLAEDDAKILRRPGKYHLRKQTI